MFVMHTTQQNRFSLIMKKMTTVTLILNVEKKHPLGENVLTQNIVCLLEKTTVTSVCVRSVQRFPQLQVHIYTIVTVFGSLGEVNVMIINLLYIFVQG